MKRIFENNNNWIELSKDETVIGFVNMCVIALAKELNLNFTDALNKLQQKNLISNYLISEYDSLHIESMKAIVKKILTKI